MEKRSNSIRDPFLATGEFAIDNYVLDSNIDYDLTDQDFIHADSLKSWENKSNDPRQRYESICGTRNGNISKT